MNMMSEVWLLSFPLFLSLSHSLRCFSSLTTLSERNLFSEWDCGVCRCGWCVCVCVRTWSCTYVTLCAGTSIKWSRASCNQHEKVFILYFYFFHCRYLLFVFDLHVLWPWRDKWVLKYTSRKGKGYCNKRWKAFGERPVSIENATWHSQNMRFYLQFCGARFWRFHRATQLWYIQVLDSYCFYKNSANSEMFKKQFLYIFV